MLQHHVSLSLSKCTRFSYQLTEISASLKRIVWFSNAFKQRIPIKTTTTKLRESCQKKELRKLQFKVLDCDIPAT